MGKSKVAETLFVVVVTLTVTVYLFYETKWLLGTPIWRGFWVLAISMGVCLIVGIVRILRQSSHERGKATRQFKADDDYLDHLKKMR
jgi:hypothetical protein